MEWRIEQQTCLCSVRKLRESWSPQLLSSCSSPRAGLVGETHIQMGEKKKPKNGTFCPVLCLGRRENPSVSTGSSLMQSGVTAWALSSREGGLNDPKETSTPACGSWIYFPAEASGTDFSLNYSCQCCSSPGGFLWRSVSCR